MDIQKVIQALKTEEIIESTEYQQLAGGTTSSLFLIDNKYVVKFNEPHVLESEAFFLDFYKEVRLLPNLLYAERSYRYIVYSFISGFTNYDRKNKRKMLKELVERLINHYKPALNPDGWGWTDAPAKSWRDFLLDEMMEARQYTGSILNEADSGLVLELAESQNRNRFNSHLFLIHGDCGVHNFLFKAERLNGVIDPTPLYGAPLFDLIYAFCSSPDDLTKETIEHAASHLMIEGNNCGTFLYEEVIIGLYLRLAACMKHHPNDLEEYLKAWYYWKDIINRG